jgi:hypothetical protein
MPCMKLAAWLETNSVKPMEFGERIGLKQPNSIYRYMRGERVPENAILAAIIRETGGSVGFEDFVSVGEEPADTTEAA